MPNLWRIMVLPVFCVSGSVAGDIQDVAQSLHHGVITHRHIQSYLLSHHPPSPPSRPASTLTNLQTRQRERAYLAEGQIIKIIVPLKDR